MDKRDEFSKWMTSVEEALASEASIVDEELLEQGACGGCGAWDCPECFPEKDAAPAAQAPITIIIGGQQGAQATALPAVQAPPEEIDFTPQNQGIGMAGTHPVGADTYDHSEEDEIDMTTMGDVEFEEDAPEEGATELTKGPLPHSDTGGVKLGHIVRKFVKSIDDAGMTGDLEEDASQNSEMINKIMSMQEMGLSNADVQYSEEQLMSMAPEEIQSIYGEVTGNMSGVAASTPAEAPPTASAPVPAPSEMMQENKSPKFRLTISEAIKIDDIIREGLDSLTFEDEELEESSLSKVLGKNKGGQQLVSFLHKKHKLSNEAELEPVKFNKDLLWSQFKSNPDDFVIVSGENGAAGIKPSKKHFDDYVSGKLAKGQVPNPGRNSSLQYQIVAFTDDGERVDPELLRPKPEAGEEPEQRDSDPTVMRARMGKNIGSDLQNQNNTFRLLNDQIGPINTVWVSGFGGYRGDPDSVKPATGSVERDKMRARDELGAGPNRQKSQEMPEDEAVDKIFKMIQPVLSKLLAGASAPLTHALSRAQASGDEGQIKKVSDRLEKLDQFAKQLSSGEANSSTFSGPIKNALASASGAPRNTADYKQYLSTAAKGNRAALKPVLDAVRNELFDNL